ncbi:MAG: hypothetical protein J0L84_13850 [Verrucomicrobia bacterium]|nr:hypothetical protein [Verrucomicrobiota bacterium]
MRFRHLLLTAVVLMAFPRHRPVARDLPPDGLFARTNLVAWCIVPFDSRKRSPEERAAMLERLGVKRLAYDWRAEHIPTFDDEVAALRRHGIELTAWWFPAGLNDEAQAILACLERHRLHPQLWVTMGTEPEPDTARLAAKLDGAAATLAPVCAAAARLGSTVGLYNHLGWFGEPTNQVAVIARLRALGHTNVGCVYNLHHGHDHLDTFPAQLAVLKPHLLAVNLNGMVRQGDRVGRKIIPLGSGDEELRLLRELQASGWRGPVGILGHTDEDAEVKLRKELEGLARLTPLLAAAPDGAGVPGSSGKDPGSQAEKDWVDNRWQATEIGPFLASNLKLPSGPPVAKGLSISVGDRALAAVAYEMGTASFRAAWTGGFLKFDPTRFGLIGMPRPASEPWLMVPSPAWGPAQVRVEGWRVHGPRTVLECRVDQMRVQETPWADATPAGVVVRRDFALGPRTQSFQILVSRHDPEGKDHHVAVEHSDSTTETAGVVTRQDREVARYTWKRDGRIHVTTVLGKVGPTKGLADGLVMEIAPSTEETLLAVAYWTGPEAELPAYLDWERNHLALSPVAPFVQPGPPRWRELRTSGQRGPDADFLAVDTLTLPYDNPWRALLFASGVDIAPDGSVYMSTMHGDVWRVTGVDESLRSLTWQRFATGLFQPLGLQVRDGAVFVLGRDRITRLHDENGDGEADRYESFFDGIATSTGGHDYVTCLEKDTAGNFYYVDPAGVHRVSADGQGMETLATGFRNPNGMGVRPDGRVVTVAPQQGEWTPSSFLAEVRSGGYYGYGGPKPGPERPAGYDAPLCWIPHAVDNSSGSQVWVPEGQWGALGGQLLHLLWGRCGLMLVLRDTGNDPSGAALQGAVVPLPGKLLSGPNRGAFHPGDGSLFLAGSTGWQTSAVKDGSLQRVRFTGKRAALPVGYRVRPGGMEIRFSVPLDRSTAEDTGSYALRQWNYRYARAYGSKDWSVTDPDREGRDEVTIRTAKLQPDGQTVWLEIPTLAPVMQWELKYNLDATDGGRPLKGALWGTVNRVEPGR